VSFATRVERYDAGAPDEQSVTPQCLRKAFRDLFAVDLDASEARALARSLGNGEEEVSYAAFAAALDGRRVPYGDAAPERERNPVAPEPEVPEPEPGFSALAADAAFREGLLAAHETIARSWLALRRLQADDRRDLSYDAFARGLELYGAAAATGGAARRLGIVAHAAHRWIRAQARPRPSTRPTSARPLPYGAGPWRSRRSRAASPTAASCARGSGHPLGRSAGHPSSRCPPARRT
jgi:hypothetical protein